MKKILYVITAAIFICGIFVYIQKAQAHTVVTDQYCAPPTNGSTKSIGAYQKGISQYFKPNQNHITDISLYLRVDGNGQYRVTLYDNTTHVLVHSAWTQSEPGYTGSYGALLNGFDIAVNTSHIYKITIQNVAGNTLWYYQGAPYCTVNSNTYASIDGHPAENFDMGYSIKGYNLEATPSGSSSSSSGSSTASNTGITNTTSPTQTTSSGNVPADSTVQAPQLYQVLGDGKDIPPTDGYYDISYQKWITIVGVGTPGQKILATIDGKNYQTTVNSASYWGVTVGSDSFKEGNYPVSVQAQNSDGKGSQLVALLSLKKIDLVKQALALSEDDGGIKWYEKLFLFSPLVGLILTILFFLFCIFILVVIVLTVVLVLRHKKKKKANLEVDNKKNK